MRVLIPLAIETATLQVEALVLISYNTSRLHPFGIVGRLGACTPAPEQDTPMSTLRSQSPRTADNTMTNLLQI